MLGGIGDWLSGAGQSWMGRSDWRPDKQQLDQTQANDDLARSLQVRQQQQNLAGSLSATMSGKGPTVAEQQMRAGMAEATNRNLSLANSGVGANRSRSLRAAMYANADLAARTNQQAAMQRSAEQLQAQNSLGSVLGQTQQADLAARGQSIQAADANLQAGIADQQMRKEVALQNAELGQKGTAGAVSSLGTVAAGAASLFSDERCKEVISRRNLDPIKPKAFRYKPGMAEAMAEGKPPAEALLIVADARKPRMGVMAQDMEESPEGSEAVKEGPGGLKQIDVNRGLAFALAQLGGLNERLSRIEGKKKVA